MNAVDDPLDLLARRSLDRIAGAAAALLDVPLVLISVIDGPRQIYVGAHGLLQTRTNEPSPLCREVAIAGRPIVLQDARRRLPRAARGIWGFELVAYAGIPLNLLERSRTGTLAGLTPARRAWQSNDLHVLRCLADAAAAVVDVRTGCEELIGEDERARSIGSRSRRRKAAVEISSSR